MTVLPEPKYERFAQAIATGKSILLASRLAGYQAAAYELARDEVIKTRVAEILEEGASRAVMESREWQERETRRARVDIREFFNLETKTVLPMDEWSDEAVEAIESFEVDRYGGFKFKLAKTGAMNNLGKMHKLLTDKIELDARVSADVRSITSEMTKQQAAESYAAMLVDPDAV